MNYAAAMGAGFEALLDPSVILLLLIGMLAGTFVGVVPGLGGAVLLTMLLPFLYGLNVVQGLALMVSAHASIYFAGSITAILLNTPGAPESAPTTIDGYQMTRQGKAARALGISAAATTLGGWIGFVALIGVIPLMFPLITILRPPEFLLLAILAVVLVSQLHSGSLTKGLLSGTFGFLMAFVGYDPIRACSASRSISSPFTMDTSIVVVALGLFAMNEMYHLYGAKRALAGGVTLSLSEQPGARVMTAFGTCSTTVGWCCARPRSACWSAWFPASAALPVTSFPWPGRAHVAPPGALRYRNAGRHYRAGILLVGERGVVIHSDARTRDTEHGRHRRHARCFADPRRAARPDHADNKSFARPHHCLGLAITSLFPSLIGLALARWLARITLLPGPMLVPFVYVLAMLGAYAATTNMLEVGAVIVFGVVGLFMRRLGYSLPGAIIGFILGGVVQNNLYLTERLGGWRFVTQPLADVLLILIAVVLVAPFLQRRSQIRRAKSAGEIGTDGSSNLASQIRAVPEQLSTLELVVDIIWVAFTGAYVVAAWTIRQRPVSCR